MIENKNNILICPFSFERARQSRVNVRKFCKENSPVRLEEQAIEKLIASRSGKRVVYKHKIFHSEILKIQTKLQLLKAILDSIDIPSKRKNCLIFHNCSEINRNYILIQIIEYSKDKNLQKVQIWTIM
ncbi:MAG TPA: hypothetical protein PKD83_01890 [Ignavibacteria bacterium]|nr:hypothetical protein [Ignavibacteria bacterium]